MAHDVTMPQLGMTQDTGIIVSWAKALGDAVKAGDVLMEVETDKATMEVEALNDGFLIEIRSPAGSDVPVGDVVAVISASAGDVVASSAAKETAPAQEAQAKPTPVKTPTKPPPASLASNGKILASPKAKQEAKRRGIDLSMLARQGVVQPFHFADVVNSETKFANANLGNSVVSAKLSRKAFNSFQDWLIGELESQIGSGVIVASFASGALRSCGGADASETLQCDIRPGSPMDEQFAVVDADYNGLMTDQITGAETHSKLVIYDLTKTRLTSLSPSLQSNQIAIVLTAASKKKLNLHCHYNELEFSTEKALAFTSELAGRLSVPLRNLL